MRRGLGPLVSWLGLRRDPHSRIEFWLSGFVCWYDVIRRNLLLLDHGDLPHPLSWCGTVSIAIARTSPYGIVSKNFAPRFLL